MRKIWFMRNIRGIIVESIIRVLNEIDSSPISKKSSRFENLCATFEDRYVWHYEDDEWVVIEPKDLDTMRKFGKESRWCVLSPDYFMNHTSRTSVLLCIPKENGKPNVLSNNRLCVGRIYVEPGCNLGIQAVGEKEYWSKKRILSTLSSSLVNALCRIVGAKVE